MYQQDIGVVHGLFETHGEHLGTARSKETKSKKLPSMVYLCKTYLFRISIIKHICEALLLSRSSRAGRVTSTPNTMHRRKLSKLGATKPTK